MITRKTGVSACCLLLILSLRASAAIAAAAPRDNVLRQHLISFLEGGSPPGSIFSAQPLSPLRSYPVTATTAYLLLEDEPALLEKFYPDISRMVMQLFAETNVTGGGLVKGMPGASSGSGAALSPGFNALAVLELYSLHLIAWKTGAYEDALEFLAWSNSLADLATRSFYDPARACFYPVDPSGRFVTTYGPGQLLPLVTDRCLGAAAHGRIAAEYRAKSASLPRAKQKSIDAQDPWDDPLMRFTMLDLLATAVPADGELFLALRSSAQNAVPAADPGRSAWSEYWRENRFVRGRLFPRWRSISSLMNLALLFQREALVQPKELAGLRGGIDSLVAALSNETMSLDSYKASTAVVNRLLSRITRFSELLDLPKERWRVFDDTKWVRLSPRTKRLVKEGLVCSRSELSDAKVDLSVRLEHECGIVFGLDVPKRPIPTGTAVEFTVSLLTVRDTLVASQFYVQIGDNRWKMMEGTRIDTLISGGAPLRYEGALTLPPALEPGIVTLPASIDFFHEGRRVEIHRVESIALTKEYDAVLDMPEGRRIKGKPVPVEITLMYKGDHDIQGTVDGAFLREFVTTPPLPSRFLVSKDSERTDLSLTIAPKGVIAPGRYPFSLTMTLDGKPVALFEETLVRPFRWLHCGALTKSDEALRNALAYQTDLFRAYATSDGRALRWKEVPPGAIDNEGSLWPQRLYGKLPGRCVLLYTAADAPARMKLFWKLATKNTVSFWINSELVVSGGDGHTDETTGPVELRKGPNSFLIAACWDDTPDGILFELSDANGLPPTGLNNELDVIVDGYERLFAAENGKKKEGPPTERIKDVVVRYTNASAAEVCVIGSFNNWEPGATPMRREGKGAWTASVHLRAGKYPYKFLVNRKQKIVDPANPVTEPDGFGGSNSVLEVR